MSNEARHKVLSELFKSPKGRKVLSSYIQGPISKSHYSYEAEWLAVQDLPQQSPKPKPIMRKVSEIVI